MAKIFMPFTKNVPQTITELPSLPPVHPNTIVVLYIKLFPFA